MQFRHILVTGGAGFAGSNLAIRLVETFEGLRVTAFDSLKRRGSELALPRLRAADVGFEHGDIRCPEDLAALPHFDLMLDCSAEPSVHAGATGSPRYVLQTNLAGALNCLEAARERSAAFLFLSSSRVYPMEPLRGLRMRETDTRLVLDGEQPAPGISDAGITEDFPLAGARSFYGASKLAGELVLQEYAALYGMPGLVNRSGLLAGPWQMGKVDQGVVTLWAARHHFGLPLRYMGFGGTGKQVRDVLHIDDLFDLLCRQMAAPGCWDGRVYNVGGGPPNSVSLRELTALCREATGRTVDIAAEPDTAAVDIPWYVTDAGRARDAFDWRPRRDAAAVVHDIAAWLRDYEDQLRPLFGG